MPDEQRRALSHLEAIRHHDFLHAFLKHRSFASDRGRVWVVRHAHPMSAVC
jgi:hypothetical protein